MTTTAAITDAQGPEAQAALRATGLKVTAGRVAVLEALEHAPHVDAEAVLALVRDRLPGTSVQSIHNVLGDLVDAGLVRRFTPARQAARYERRVGDNHHHAVCSSCGRVDDVDCVVGEAPCLHADAPSGFVVAVAEVTFVGICADCLAAAAAEEPAP